MELSREAILRMFDGRGGSGGGGGGMNSAQIAAMLAGYATQDWVNGNYVSIEFFNRLFSIHGTTDNVIVPNDLETTIANIEAKFGVWTQSFISALGLNGSGGGGGGSSTLAELLDVNLGTLADGQVLTYDSSTQKWVNGAGGGGGTGSVRSVGMTVPTGFTISGSPITSSGTLALGIDSEHSLPLTSDVAKGVAAYSWGDHAAEGYATRTWVQQQGYITGETYTGTVTRVAMTVPTGLAVSGSPITSSGTLAISTANGYSIPRTADVTKGVTAYDWGNHADAGYATQTWVGDNYVSIEFFNRLFRVHGADDVVIVPNDIETTIQNIEARFGLWTESFLSALGLNSSGSGGGGGASYLNDLLDVNISSPATGDGLVFDGTRWVNGPVGGGGSGSVERVALTMPTGFSVAGSPVTSSGTLAVTFASGYSLPTTVKQNQWDAAYGWGDHSVQGYATQTWVNSMLPSSTDINNWNTAYSNSHTHSNKSVLDGITSTKTNHWDTAYGWGNHADAGYATQTALAAATSRIGTLEGYFSDGSAKTALRLADNDTHYAWGQPFWQNGVAKNIGSASERVNISYAGSVSMGWTLAMEYDSVVHDPAIYMKSSKTGTNLLVLTLSNSASDNHSGDHLAIGYGTSAFGQLPIRFFGREFVFNFTTDTVGSSGDYQTAEAMKVGYRSFGTEKEPAVYVRKHLMIGNGAGDYFPVTYDSANNALCFTGNIYATGGISALGFQATPGGGTLFDGPFTVNGAATLNSSLTALGATTLNDTLTVTGAATFRDSIYIYYGGTRYTLSISKLINQGLLT